LRLEGGKRQLGKFFVGEGKVAGVIVLDVAHGQNHGVSLIVNPDKLSHLGPVADRRALLREGG
jgi:RNA polymerase sigma-70 factor (ECF subfamily)